MKKWLTFLCLASGLSLQADVSGYAHRLDFSVVGYRGTETLVNFPLGVRLSEGIQGFRYSDFLSAGSDLRFTLADGTELQHELESWDTTGTSVAWVKVPAFANGLKLSMHYGKANDVAPEQAVFKDAGYCAVYHLDEQDGVYADATGNGFGAENVATAGERASEKGVFGRSVRISNGAQGAKGGAVKSDGFRNAGLTDQATVSFWAKYCTPGQAVGDDVYFSLGQKCKVSSYWGSPRSVVVLDPGCWCQEYNWRGINHGNALAAAVTDGAWHFMTVAFSGRDVWIYENGALRYSARDSAVSAMNVANQAFVIGNAHDANGNSFKGMIDEARIHPEVLSADWIAAEYDAATDEAGTFLSLYRKTVYVVPPSTVGHAPVAPYCTWETAATDIQTAVDSNVQGFDVEIAPGVYPISAPISLNNAGATYTCVDPVTGQPVANGAVIDAGAQPLAACAVVLDGASMRGFKIVGATNATDKALGGGLRVMADADATHFVADTTVEGCCILTGGSGGGVYVDANYRGYLTNCTVRQCAAAKGGGLYCANTAAAALESHATVMDCSFDENVMNGSWGNGGAAYAAGLRFERCSFAGNSVGPGLSSYASCLYLGGRVQLIDCRFSGNKGCSHGASAVFALQSAGADVVCGCTFLGNESKAYSGEGLVESSVFSNNADKVVHGSPSLRNCLVCDNAGTGVVTEGRPTKLTNAVENCTIVRNGSYGLQGAAHNNGSRTIIVNSVLSGNAAGQAGAYDYATWSANDCIISNSVVSSVYRNGSQDAPQGKNHWTTAFDALKMVDPGNGNYRLRRKSFCRDKGLALGWMTSEATDLDGKARVFGGSPDLGCYEADEPAPGLVFTLK